MLAQHYDICANSYTASGLYIHPRHWLKMPVVDTKEVQELQGTSLRNQNVVFLARNYHFFSFTLIDEVDLHLC